MCLNFPMRPSGGMADAEASKASARNGVWVRLPPRARIRFAPLAQLAEQDSLKVKVPGSIPGGRTE